MANELSFDMRDYDRVKYMIRVAEKKMEELEQDGKDESTFYNELDNKLERLYEIFNPMDEEYKVFLEKQYAERELEERIRAHEDRVKRLFERFDGDYKAWLKWALSLYEITEDHTLISNAANWSEEKSWKHSSRIEALEKLEQLVYYKYYDHFIREDRQHD